MDYKQVITFYEKEYWFEGEYPSIQKVLAHFNGSIEELRAMVGQLENAIASRDLPPVGLVDQFLNERTFALKKPIVPELKSNEPDPEFVVVVSLICDLLDKRSVAIKLKAVGWNTARWKAALRKKANSEYYERRVQDTFKDTNQDAKIALSKNVVAGDLQSIKYFHEFTGQHRPNQEVLLNVGVLIGRLMEILPKYLNSNQLVEIADEFEVVLNHANRQAQALEASN